MKNIFLIVFVFIGLSAQAQNAFSGSSVSANGLTFICKNNIPNITKVFHTQNIYSIGTMTNLPTLPPSCRIGYISPEDLKQVLKSVFSASRCNELAQEDFMIAFYIERESGILKELYYYISGVTRITPQEIAQLEVAFKAKVYFQLKRCEGGDGIVIENSPIDFSEVYR